MKYMGSKRWMLGNGLGDLLKKESSSHNRFVDLFSGSGAVSFFAAQNLKMEVLSVDLQEYSAVLSRAILERTTPLDSSKIWSTWFENIDKSREKSAGWNEAKKLDEQGLNISTWSKRAKELCGNTEKTLGTISNAYGGYYFSPTQALTFDSMIDCLPDEIPVRFVCHAAIISAASMCVASPGHTAQPFKSSRSAGPYLREAWERDPLSYLKKELESICSQYSAVKGKAVVGDALEITDSLNEGDLVFVDPPYSGVHYSRFYHVLETIARGQCSDVSGSGRYPPAEERPVSSFSRKSESYGALVSLIDALALAECTVVFTFPSGVCSNGLSGLEIQELAKSRFKVKNQIVKSKFSTLGGNNSHRRARIVSDELILLLEPR